MKSPELKLGKVYGVIPAWEYSSSEKKNPLTVERNGVAKAELLSLEKYEYKVFRFESEVNPNFVLAPKGTRSVGYLVKSTHWASKGQPEVFWLARAQDIIAEYDGLEKGWNIKEAVELKRQEEENLIRETKERKEKAIEEYEQRNLNAVLDSLRSLIGDKRMTEVDSELRNRRYNGGDYAPSGTVTMSTKVVQVLVEKILEARELVS